MRKLLILINVVFLFGLTQLAFADAKSDELIKRYDVGLYHPGEFGLKDLSVEVRIPSLVKKLNEQMIFGKLNDVYFQVFWVMDPAKGLEGKYKVEVIGLPNGFSEMKKGLVAMVRNRLDFIIPRKLSKSLSEYSKTNKKLKNGSVVKCEDLTHKKGADRMDLYFDNRGRLFKHVTYSPAGRSEAEITLGSASWSANKWIPKKIVSRSYQGIQTTEVEQTLSYKKIGGFGFPTEVSVITSQKLSRPTAPNEERVMRKVESKLVFSNFRANQGISKKAIYGR